MRVALVGFDPVPYSVELANALADGNDVLLIKPAQRFDAYRERLDPRVDTLILDSGRLRSVGRQLRGLWQIHRRLRAFRPDVIHLQMADPWFSLLLWGLRRYPLVITVHDPVPHRGDEATQRLPPRLVAADRRRADRLIVHGPSLRDALAATGHDPARIDVVPHIAQSAGPAPPDVAEIPHRVLFFGRIWEYKGLEYLIRAEPEIARRVPDVEIVIAGQGEDFGRYRALMTDPARYLVDNTYISETQAAAYFASSSVVVLPYIDASQSGVVSLAYSYGKAVVVTSVGELQGLVDDGITGLVVAPRDAGAIADAVVSLLLDADLRHELGRRGTAKMNEECGPGVVGDIHLEIYRRAIREHLTPKR